MISTPQYTTFRLVDTQYMTFRSVDAQYTTFRSVNTQYTTFRSVDTNFEHLIYDLPLYKNSDIESSIDIVLISSIEFMSHGSRYNIVI